VLLSEDVRENPGTLALTAAWVVVFALIQWVQWLSPVTPVPIPDVLPVSTAISHRFGDMTWLEIRQGESWRLLTATFVHFGLLHLFMNGVALFNLGRLVEPWYRTGPFLAICLLIGGLGNFLGGAIRQAVGLARPWLVAQSVAWHLPHRIERFLQGGPAGSEAVHTGGGSTILLGLLTLAAVVGWRSRTRIGAHLQRQMLILLGLTAVLGVVMYQLVDNYGHLGGAIVGAVIGLFDPPLLRFSASKWFRRISWTAALCVMFACVGIAIRDDRVEVEHARQVVEVNRRVILDDGLRGDLVNLYALYVKLVVRSSYFTDPVNELDELAVVELLKGMLALTLPKNPPPDQAARDRAELEALIGRLEKVPSDVWGPVVAEDLQTLRSLAKKGLDRPVNYQDVYDFLVAWKPTFRVIVQDLTTWNARRMELDQVGRNRQ
jgi:rhomboid protease GluP